MARLCREMVNAHLTGVVNGSFTLWREFRPETGPMRTPACLWRQAGPTGAMRPQVIIIGRPNVGKSTLFNRLVGKKLALVDDQPGVTRDRRFGDASLLGLEFTIVDTAGWEDEDPSSLPGRMRMQTEASLEGADVALFVIDARAGLTPLDEEIGRYLRGHDIPVILLANKAEGRAGDHGLFEAFSLGFGEPVGVSAEHGEGMGDLFEALLPHIGEKQDDEDEASGEEAEYDPKAVLKLAIVGRPNAGKSTLINRFLGEDRLLTGPEAGSPAIRSPSTGLDRSQGWRSPPDPPDRHRRHAQEGASRRQAGKAFGRRCAPRHRFCRSGRALLDATRGLEHQDLKIASMVLEEGRALIIAINKWDVAEDASGLFNGVRQALDDGLAQVRGVPLVAVSARTGKGLDTLLSAAFSLRDAWSRRVPTAALNRWFDDALAANPPPAPGGKPHQAALHHPGQDAPARLRAVRHAAGPVARKLSPLSGQRHPPRTGL
jgi:GTP-binding protein